MAKLGHEGIGTAGKQQCDGGVFTPALLGQDALFPGKAHGGFPEEGKTQQQFHKGQHGGNGQQHGGKYQQLLDHVGMVRGRQIGIEAQGIVKPDQGNGHAVFIMGSQPVIGFQQLHPPGAAVIKTAEGGVPGCFSRCTAKKFCPEVTVENFVIDKVLVIPEIAEFVIFGLEQQNIVEIDAFGIVGIFPEEFAALQYGGFGGDIHTVGIHRTGVSRSNGPAGPGTHGMAA